MMRYFILLPLIILGSVMPLSLSSCVSRDSSLQSRIESKIKTPVNNGIQIDAEHYNQFSQDFEGPWPFGPYSSF
jgi:hypothetical protein